MRTIKFFILFAFLACIFSCSEDEQPDISDQIDIDTEIEKRQVTLADWRPRECAAISIFINGNCAPNWVNSLAPAMQAYNDLDVAINMVLAPSALQADIVIDCVNMGGDFAGTRGLGEWPDVDGEIGGQIFLNTDFDNECANLCYYQAIMMHEIGHNLGLAHNGIQAGIDLSVGSWTFNSVTGEFTNDNPNITLEGLQILGTANGVDPQSVFNAGLPDCNNPDCTFSQDDITALTTLYPLGDVCDCIEVLDDPCDCPTRVDDICDCPEAITDPCDCPELFPEETEFKCYCVCYQLTPIEETKNFETEYVEYSRTEVDCNQAATTSCTSENTSLNYCEIVRECELVPEEEEEEECFCECTIESTINFPEPISWEFIIDCNKPQECDSPNANANCRIIRR